MDARSDLSLDQLIELDRLDRLAGADADGEEPPDAPGDAVVLPWWQHPVNIVTLVVTAAILAGMVG